MMGRLIPAGTGFQYYRHVHIPPDEPPPPPPPTPEELELEREMEYFVERKKPLPATRSSRSPGSGFRDAGSVSHSLSRRRGEDGRLARSLAGPLRPAPLACQNSLSPICSTFTHRIVCRRLRQPCSIS
jgi:hypothetical protein